MRRILALIVLLACAAAFAGCRESNTATNAGGANAPSNAAQGGAANANGANANAANAPGAREGTGPGGTGIGGTSEGNRNATVSGNSNVEPTGVNRNVGATPPAANRNR